MYLYYNPTYLIFSYLRKGEFKYKKKSRSMFQERDVGGFSLNQFVGWYYNFSASVSLTSTI